jgi:hypothetical protein
MKIAIRLILGMILVAISTVVISSIISPVIQKRVDLWPVSFSQASEIGSSDVPESRVSQASQTPADHTRSAGVWQNAIVDDTSRGSTNV